jgi:hypothetical protein
MKLELILELYWAFTPELLGLWLAFLGLGFYRLFEGKTVGGRYRICAERY